jgi:hypothetical protein
VDFTDRDGNIIVPRSVRPIIELSPTRIGAKKGALRQYRHGNLHIREYDTHYSVHVDRVDPLKNPLGHLVVDAPEYLAAAAAAALVARRIGTAAYKEGRGLGRNRQDAAAGAIAAGYVAGSAAGRIVHDAVNEWKKKRRAR